MKIDREHDPRWKVLGDYVRDIADRMGLSRWYFEISHDLPSDHGAVASEGCEVSAYVTYTFQTMNFILHFGDAFFESSPYQQRDVIVHELCHVIEIPRMGCIHVLSKEDCLSNALYNHWFQHYDREREKSIDWFSALIAPRFPEPQLTTEEVTDAA